MNDKKSKVWIWILAAVTAITAFCIGGYFFFMHETGSGVKQILRIGHINITDHLLLGVSQSKDGESFKNFNLETTSFENWTLLKEALLKGDLEGAFILAPLGMNIEENALHEEDIHTKAILLGHRDGSALMVKTGTDIKTASDFKGKTIAIPEILSVHNILLHLMVTKAGLDYRKDIIPKVMAPQDMPFALIADEIDAYIVAEPFGAQVEEYEYGKIFALSREILPDHICCVLVIREDYIEKNPETIQELVDSLVRSGEFIEKNPEESSVIGGRFLGQAKKTIYRVLTVPDDRVSYDRLVPNRESFNELQDYIVDVMGISDRKLDMDEWLDPGFAEKSLEYIGDRKSNNTASKK